MQAHLGDEFGLARGVLADPGGQEAALLRTQGALGIGRGPLLRAGLRVHATPRWRMQASSALRMRNRVTATQLCERANTPAISASGRSSK